MGESKPFAAMILETPKTEDTDLEKLFACLYDYDYPLIRTEWPISV